MEKDVVIVGAGHAGISCAEALRIKGFKGTLTVVDRQIGFPTEKPPLSKGAIVNGTNEDYSVPLLKPEKWYIDNNIDLKTGITATSIDRINRNKSFKQKYNLLHDTCHCDRCCSNRIGNNTKTSSSFYPPKFKRCKRN